MPLVDNFISGNPIIWILAGFDIPFLILLVIRAINLHRKIEHKLAQQDKTMSLIQAEFDKSLMDIRLETANNYARLSVVQDLERRLISHLLRIESKLDVTALKAEAAQHLKQT